MKFSKKALASVLSAAMVLSMSVSAFATSTASLPPIKTSSTSDLASAIEAPADASTVLPVISIVVPAKITYSLDPLNAGGMGQIVSPEFPLQNKSNVKLSVVAKATPTVGGDVKLKATAIAKPNTAAADKDVFLLAAMSDSVTSAAKVGDIGVGKYPADVTAKIPKAVPNKAIALDTDTTAVTFAAKELAPSVYVGGKFSTFAKAGASEVNYKLFGNAQGLLSTGAWAATDKVDVKMEFTCTALPNLDADA